MAKIASPFSRYTRATVEDYTRHRLIGLSFGEPGSRKTSFWLEAPGPIVVMSFDKGLEGVVDRVLRENPSKEIYVKEYEWLPTLDTSQEEAIALRDEFTADFEHAIQNARTVLWDKENDVWELFRYAEFGAPNDAPRNYPALNQRYRRLINMPKATDINFGLVEGMKDEWGSKVNKKTGAQGAAATGNRIRSGFGELDGLVHMVLQHHGVGPNDWAFTVGKVRGPGGVAVAGETFPNLSFPEFAQLVFPDSSPEDWE
jgi:hypothetical protein